MAFFKYKKNIFYLYKLIDVFGVKERLINNKIKRLIITNKKIDNNK